jgi:hypothetical protein
MLRTMLSIQYGDPPLAEVSVARVCSTAFLLVAANLKSCKWAPRAPL